MDDETRKLLEAQGAKALRAGRLAFDLLFGDHETAGREVAEDVARQAGRPHLAREIAETAPATQRSGAPIRRNVTKTNQPPSNVIDGEFVEDKDNE